MKNNKILFNDIPWERPIPGARFKAHKRDGKSLRFVEFTKELVEPDWCQKGHIGYVLSGEMEIDFDGEIVPYKSGDGIFIPAGEKDKHIVTVFSEAVRLILVEDA